MNATQLKEIVTDTITEYGSFVTLVWRRPDSENNIVGGYDIASGSISISNPDTLQVKGVFLEEKGVELDNRIETDLKKVMISADGLTYVPLTTDTLRYMPFGEQTASEFSISQIEKQQFKGENIYYILHINGHKQ